MYMNAFDYFKTMLSGFCRLPKAVRVWFYVSGPARAPILATPHNGKCIAHWFFKIVNILNTKFQHTSAIEMYCVENKACVVLGASAHGFQDSKGPKT
jgi:hypothetical protein